MKKIEKLSKEEYYTSPFSRDYVFYKINEIIDCLNHNMKPELKKNPAEKYKDENGYYDLPIGTKFLYKGKKCIVEEKFDCIGCGFFKECPQEMAYIKSKCGFARKDNTPVIFREIK
jgi:hypothetical protein